MANPNPIDEVPPDVLAALSGLKQIAEPIGHWKIKRLSLSNPTFRVKPGSGPWIIKQPKDPDKEILVGELFTSWGVRSFEIAALGSGWLVYEDLDLPSLAQHLRQGAAALSDGLFERLGAVALQADLVAMRDRKLDNVLVQAGPSPDALELVMVDYEGAFEGSLFERLVRPHRYVSYLTTRLFFDVLFAALGRPADSASRDRWLCLFRQGMVREQTRLNAQCPKAALCKRDLTWRQHLVVRSRIRGGHQLSRALARGLDRAERKTRPAGGG